MAAAAYVEKKWGGPTRLVPIPSVAIGGPQRLLQNNPRRMGWFIFNSGNATAYIWFDNTVSSSVGFPLPPIGGAASMSVDEDGEEVTREVWVTIAAGIAQMAGWEVMAK
jgi:hypothetical protein